MRISIFTYIFNMNIESSQVMKHIYIYYIHTIFIFIYNCIFGGVGNHASIISCFFLHIAQNLTMKHEPFSAASSYLGLPEVKVTRLFLHTVLYTTQFKIQTVHVFRYRSIFDIYINQDILYIYIHTDILDISIYI